jgi:hypothetical protein
MVTKEGFDLYRAFLDGDFTALANKLRSGAEISQEVRNLLADILEGNLKRPKHRPRGLATDERHFKIAKRVREMENEGWKQDAAISQATGEFQVKVSTVKTSLRKLLQKEAVELDLKAQLEAQLRAELAKTLTLEEVEKVIKYAMEEGIFSASKWAS